MSLVVIAQFIDPDAADSAAAFLELNGIKATVIDLDGPRSPGVVQLLTSKARVRDALSLLQRAERGEFVDGWPEVSDEVSQAASELSRRLLGSGYAGAKLAWLNWLPVWGLPVAFLLPVFAYVLFGRVMGWGADLS